MQADTHDRPTANGITQKWLYKSEGLYITYNLKEKTLNGEQKRLGGRCELAGFNETKM